MEGGCQVALDEHNVLDEFLSFHWLLFTEIDILGVSKDILIHGDAGHLWVKSRRGSPF